MACPSCEKHTTCGCNSCKAKDGEEDKWKDFREIWKSGPDEGPDCWTITCPHCGHSQSGVSWEHWELDKAFEDMRGQRLGKQSGIIDADR